MYFTSTHEWVRIDQKIATVGISFFAQKEVGEVVFIELPRVGEYIEIGEQAVILESTKAAIDVYTPVAGEVVEVNASLLEHPEYVNQFPETSGWFYKVRLVASLAERVPLPEWMERDLYLPHVAMH